MEKNTFVRVHLYKVQNQAKLIYGVRSRWLSPGGRGDGTGAGTWLGVTVCYALFPDFNSGFMAMFV